MGSRMAERTMRIAIIADDLTGANVDGALLTAEGFSSATCIDAAGWDAEAFAGAEAIAISTDSRLLSPEEARQRVRQAVSALARKRPALFAKRIDSTLRGNLGAEIETALEAIDQVNIALATEAKEPPRPPALAVVVPAYPKSGRLAVGGYLIVHGQALQCSPIANDPATPLTSSLTVDIIAAQTALSMALVELRTVMDGPEAVFEAIVQEYSKGTRIVVCDAVADADIAAIARALKNTGFPVMAVDPGPFTAKLAAERVPQTGAAFNNRVLAVIGSASELTQRQLEALHLAHTIHFARVDCARFLEPATRDQEIAAAVAHVSGAPKEATVIGVCTVTSEKDVLPLRELAAERGIATGELSLRINSALAEIAERLLAEKNLHIGGLYTSGGEVTVSVIRKLGGKGFSVRDEVLPLAVYGRLLQGPYHQLPMLTKGGFVGDTTGLVQCVDYLLTKISTQTSGQNP